MRRNVGSKVRIATRLPPEGSGEALFITLYRSHASTRSQASACLFWAALESLPALTRRRLLTCYAALAASAEDRQRRGAA
jgi:hypothetical protein